MIVSPRKLVVGTVAVGLALWATGFVGPVRECWCADTNKLLDARKFYLEGKYAEAEEAYQSLSGSDASEASAAAVGQARCQEAVGKREKAVEALSAAAKKYPQEASVTAEMARLALERGDLAAAQEAASAALKVDGDQLLALWVQAELYTATGKLAEADAAYKRLVDYFNAHQVKDPEQLEWIGLGAAQYARWNHLADQFHFLVNEFYPELARLEPASWRAHFEAGRLFAEKYNQAEASKEFQAAIGLNPNSAEIHAAIGRLALEEFELKAAQAAADRAIELNGQLLAAWHLKADIQLANFEPRQAVGVLGDALKLNPISEDTLGRMAAAYAAVDGVKKTSRETRFAKLVSEVTERNPHSGRFFEALADSLDRLRRWPAAADYYQQAIERMPQLVAARGQHGMMLMRLGEEERARKVLEEAFEIDPFNVRVNNSLKVLEVLAGYETLETEHFRVKFDPAHDKIVAECMGPWLEEVYPKLVAQMGFTPEGKSLFEVFSHAKNTDGHGWFRPRGWWACLTFIRSAPCAGKIVALQSPLEGERRFNWARVVKHEFIHVINLQQTDFNIPHWFTEGLAVLNEGYPRPQSWNELLAEHLAQDKLFNLDSINFGFIRPHSSADWTLAYCQAELYAEFMLKNYGDDAIAKMLAAYRDNLTTSEALERSFGVAQADFEREYRKFIESVVAQLPSAGKDAEMSLAQIEKELGNHPKDPALLARLAQAQLARRNYAEARRSADASLAVDSKNQLAIYVRARLHLLVGENTQGLERLEAGLDRAQPQKSLLSLLAGLKLKSEDYASAAELYELGAKQEPAGALWLKSLAAVYLKSGDENKLAGVLTRLADLDADDFPIRKKLAQLAHAQGDPAAAARWALEAIHVDVSDVDVHRIRAESLIGLGSMPAAAQEYAIAVELDPDEPKLRFALAQAYLKAGEPAKGKSTLEALLKAHPDFPGAKELLEGMK